MGVINENSTADPRQKEGKSNEGPAKKHGE